jgi:hypothetical protein
MHALLWNMPIYDNNGMVLQMSHIASSRSQKIMPKSYTNAYIVSLFPHLWGKSQEWVDDEFYVATIAT